MNAYEVFPAFGVPIATMLILGFVVWKGIEARHRERMMMLEKGMSAEDIRSLFKMRWSSGNRRLAPLKWGLLIFFVGAGLLLGNTLNLWYHVPDWFVPGFMLVFGGAALLVFYAIAGNRANGDAKQ
jgi:polyferredoxin